MTAEPQAVPLAMLASLLFTLMGPIAIIPGFAALTTGAPRGQVVRIALVAGGVASVAIAIAVLVGAGALAGAGTSRPALIIAAGLILLLTALSNILGFGKPSAPESGKPGPVPLAAGVSPIAIPGIVTPVGVCVLIIFVSYFPTLEHKLQVLAVALAIVALDVLALLMAQAFMRVVGLLPLIILGAIFGVLQAAMGIEMTLSGLSKASIF